MGDLEVINLREIVETLHDSPDSFWDTKFIFPIIEAVIEERAKVIRVTQRQQGLPEPKVLTVAESKEVALHELNLEGVWPVKEA